MSHIIIHRPHNLTPNQARQTAEHIAAQLAERFAVHSRWEEDSLHFERSGVSGQIDLEPGEMRISVRLGFLLIPFKPRLEAEIHQQLDALLSPPCSAPSD